MSNDHPSMMAWILPCSRPRSLSTSNWVCMQWCKYMHTALSHSWSHIQGFNPPKPGSQSKALCGVVYTLSIANSTYTSASIVSLLNLFFHFSSVLFVLHDYNGSHCYTSIYYNYKSIWPYYIDMTRLVVWAYIIPRHYILPHDSVQNLLEWTSSTTNPHLILYMKICNTIPIYLLHAL